MICTMQFGTGALPFEWLLQRQLSDHFFRNGSLTLTFNKATVHKISDQEDYSKTNST